MAGWVQQSSGSIPTGAVRRFDPYWNEPAFAFPSLPARALEAGGIRPHQSGQLSRGMILTGETSVASMSAAHRHVAADLESGSPARVARYGGRLVHSGPPHSAWAA